MLVSFFGNLTTGEVAEPETAAGSTLRVASPLDIAGTKAATVQRHAQARDYIGIDAPIRHGIGLPRILAAGAAVYGRNFNPLITLKALTYFAMCRRCRTRSSIARAKRSKPSTRAGFRYWLHAGRERRRAVLRHGEIAGYAGIVAGGRGASFGSMNRHRHWPTRRGFSRMEYLEVLENASPGIFDKRRWAYWNLTCRRRPA